MLLQDQVRLCVDNGTYDAALSAARKATYAFYNATGAVYNAAYYDTYYATDATATYAVYNATTNTAIYNATVNATLLT